MKKRISRLIIATGFFQAILLINCYAQNNRDSLIFIQGFIRDQKTRQAVPRAHILVKETGTGAVSNENGSFMIYAMHGNTIKISSIAYYDFFYFVPDSTENQVIVKNINMIQRTYEIQEVDVYPFKNYREFKKQFFEMPEEVTAGDRLRNGIFSNPELSPATLKEIHDAANPWIPIPYKSRIEKQEEALKKILEDKPYIEKARLLAVKISGLDSLALNIFFESCGLNGDMIRAMSEYELYMYIEFKWKNYNESNQD